MKKSNAKTAHIKMCPITIVWHMQLRTHLFAVDMKTIEQRLVLSTKS